ncbi:MAG: UvrD-helicase domain-containing protein [Chloroflexota bacterium]|nr:UvrD-helicase domain-containing protein [Chloroflexota bacterium]
MTLHGENFVARLLHGLPSDMYSWFAHPPLLNCTTSFGTPHFVILSPMFGALVLELRTWSTITKVTTNSVQVQHPDGSFSTEVYPLNLAREYARCLGERAKDRYLAMYSNHKRADMRFPCSYAAALPNLDRNDIEKWQSVGLWEHERILTRQELNPVRFERLVRNLAAAGDVSAALDEEIIHIMRGVLDPTLVMRDAAGMDVGTLTSEQARLIREPAIKNKAEELKEVLENLPQEAVEAADNYNVRLVRGVAGSGKSLVLARRAQHLAETHSDQRLMVLAYNRDLVEDLQRRIPNAPQIEIFAFDDLCAHILGDRWCPPIDPQVWLEQNPNTARLMQQNGFTADFAAEEIAWRKEMNLYNGEKYMIVDREGRVRSLSKGKRSIINVLFDQYVEACRRGEWVDQSDLVSMSINALSHTHALYRAYDNVLIDEAQDFAPSWITLVKRLIKPGGNLFLCDDPTQSLFRAFSWRRRGVDVVGHARTLRVPFRNTRQIAQAAFSLVYADETLARSNDIPKPDMESYPLRTNDKPLLANCQDPVREARLVEQYVRQFISSGISADSIAVLCHRPWIVRRWSYLRKEGVYVKSFNEMKGLEFTVVIIPQLQSLFEQDSSLTDASFVSEMRRRVFTAMTRAREILIMTYVDTLPNELNLLLPYVRQELTRVERRRA